MKTICIDCGDSYEYDSTNPLGASTERCPSCRKRHTAKLKKIKLFSISTAGQPLCCVKCGYDRSVHALQLMDAKSYLKKATTQEEHERRAKEQYLLCLNCAIEIKNREVEVKIVDSTKTPVLVEFYHVHVAITKQKVPAFKNNTRNAIEAEIITGGAPEGVERKTQKFRGIETDQVLDV